MTDAIKNKIGEIAGSTILTQAEKVTAREQVRDLRNAINKLGEERGKIPPLDSGKKPSGQFIAK